MRRLDSLGAHLRPTSERKKETDRKKTERDKEREGHTDRTEKVDDRKG